MIAEQDNITKERTEDGRLVFEPGYAGYLRSQGYSIKSIEDIDTVQSESDPEKKYLVAKITTYKYPDDHPELDWVASECVVRFCSCWDWRSNKSADLEESDPSGCGVCKHGKKKWKVARAEEDESQEKLM